MSVAPPRRLTGAARRARVVDAALHAFATQGYDAVGMGEIAEAAGVARPVLYDHFPSKRALFLTLLEEQSAQLVAHVGAAITARGSEEERMRQTVDAFFSWAERNPHGWGMLFRDGGEREAEIQEARRRLHRERVRATGFLLAADAQHAGIDPSSRQAELMVELIIAGLAGVARWWADHPRTKRAELVDAAMASLWSGLERLREARAT
jgi:AcrR family transcriptional regulator